MATWVARVAGTVGATAWLVGLPLISIADEPLPSDTGYFVKGVMGVVLGFSIAIVAIAVAWRHVAVQAVGAAIGVLLALTSLLLALAGRGNPSERAPDWIEVSTSAMFFAVFVWIVVATIASRRAFGTVALWFGLLSGAAALITAVIAGRVPSNNYTIPFLLAAAGVLWFGPAVWLLVVVWRRPEAAT